MIAADGRRSVLREAAALPRKDIGAPMDVFWFRVPKQREAVNRTTGVFAPGPHHRADRPRRLLAMRLRLSQGQRARDPSAGHRGLPRRCRRRGTGARGRNPGGGSWDDVKLLTVALDRLTRWHRPGLLAIGDAAHAMSPIGGVGINLAIQDAVAAANILAAPLARGEAVDGLLRPGPGAAHAADAVDPGDAARSTDTDHRPAAAGGPPLAAPQRARPSLALRLPARFPWLQRIPAWVVGLGFRREHIRSPEVSRR